jgi:predicted MPP superfamily phosphohydrolase
VHPVTAGLLGTVAVAAGGLAYSAGYEVRSFRLRQVTVPVLDPGQPPLRVLQVTDLHMTPGQRRKQDWVRDLAALEPDLVVDTGDNLAHLEAVPAALRALEPLLERPGAFVFGSNDFYGPVPKNPVRYLRPDDGRRATGIPLPWHDLRDAMREAGWVDLTNARGTVKVGQREVELVGVDDPHVRRDRYDEVAGPATAGADLTLGVVHAPYHRVVDRMAADRLPLVLAGHTHGGQLRVPFYGALVSNCDLSPRRARGLSRHSESTLLHVSAGLGTSPYAPVRFACPPEASLLTLVPRPAGTAAAPTTPARAAADVG